MQKRREETRGKMNSEKGKCEEKLRKEGIRREVEGKLERQ